MKPTSVPPATRRANRRLAARVRQTERRQAQAARASQAGQRSVMDGDTVIYHDADGNPRVIVGATDDGTYTTVDVGGAPLAPPSAPLIATQYEAVTITWDGFDVDGLASWTNDFLRVEVHASTVPGFTPDDETQVGSFGSRYGGAMSIPLPVGVVLSVLLVAVNTSGVESPPSPERAAVSTNQLDRPTIYGGSFSTADPATPNEGQRVVIRNDADGAGRLEAFTGRNGETPSVVNPEEFAGGPGITVKAGKVGGVTNQALLQLSSGSSSGSPAEALLSAPGGVAVVEVGDVYLYMFQGGVGFFGGNVVVNDGTLSATMGGGDVGSGTFRDSVRTAAAYRETAWADATLGTAWTQSPAAGELVSYRRDSANNLHIVGGVNRASGTATGAVAFTLPVGFRPSRVQYRQVRVPTAATTATVQINTNGQVVVNYQGTAPASVGLEATIPLA